MQAVDTRIFYALLAVIQVILLSPAFADQRYISIDLQGPLDPEVRIALSRVVQPAALESLIDIERLSPRSLTDICRTERCIDDVDNEYAHLSSHQAEKGIVARYSSPVVATSGPFFWQAPESYVVLQAESASVASRFSEFVTSSGSANVVLPVSEKRFARLQEGLVYEGSDRNISSNLSAIGALWFDDYESDDVAMVSSDMEEYGFSHRQFAVSPGASKEDIDRILTIAKQNQSLNVEIGSELVTQIEWHKEEVLYLGGDAECAEDSENWPFNSTDLAALITKNKQIYNLARIDQFDQASLLIVDTGLGRKLAESSGLGGVLDIDISRALHPDYYLRRSSSVPADRICLEHNSFTNSYIGYGFSADADRVACKTKSSLERIEPLSVGQHQPGTYDPAHGSMVATLAAGGPDLLQDSKFLEILAQMIGLRIARITSESQEQALHYVVSNTMDVAASIKYAASTGTDVLNLSLKVNSIDQLRSLTTALDEFQGLVVAAAGNDRARLSTNSTVFPAVVAGDVSIEGRLLVVGALQPDDSDSVRLLSESSWSPDYVHIAAPGFKIMSWDDEGRRVCMSGTSAAAPIVAFTAALLKSHGLSRPELIRRRVLSTSENLPSLKNHVQQGRVINLMTALDVTSDLIWLSNHNEPLSGLILAGDTNFSNPAMIRVCAESDPLFVTTRGLVDVAVLDMWKREADTATVWDRSVSNFLSKESEVCRIHPDGEIKFFNFKDSSITTLKMNSIDKIVPSPFRKLVPYSKKFHSS